MYNFESYIQGTKPVVVEFYADWSESCKFMEPVLEKVKEIAGERALTVRLDVDKNHEIAEQYQIYTVQALLYLKEVI